MAITIFTPAAKDLSLEYLYTIFGNMNGVLKSAAPGTAEFTLLGEMFKTFNTIVLAVGAFVIVYVTVVGVMATAHEGQFMGKKWNNMWLPIRTVLGIAALVPTASGYSAIQIIMMWFIVQGIGAADSIWSTTLDFVSRTGTPYAKVEKLINATTEEGKPAGLASMSGKLALKEAFKGIACQATTKWNAPTPDIDVGVFTDSPLSAGYYCHETSNKAYCGTPSAVQFSVENIRKSNMVSFGPNEACGSLHYCDYNKVCDATTLAKGTEEEKTRQQKRCEACTQQTAVLSSILDQFSGMATQLASVDADYSTYFYASNKKDIKNIPPFIKSYCESKGITPENCKSFLTENEKAKDDESAAKYKVSDTGLPAPYVGNGFSQSASPFVVGAIYTPALVKQGLAYIEKDGKKINFIEVSLKQYQDALGTLPDSSDDKLTGTSKEGQDQGWLVAGAYYTSVSGMMQEAIDSVVPPLMYKNPDPILAVPDNILQSACMDSKPCRTNYDAASYFVTFVEQVSNPDDFGNTETGPAAASSLAGPVSDSVAALTASMTETMKASSIGELGRGAIDPLTALIQFGGIMLWVVGALYVVLLAILLATGIGGNISIFVLGTGFTNPVGPTAMLLSLMVMPAIMGFLAICLGLGATLGMYVPFIPFVIFTLGAIGWFTSVIEAMVAGPLVALGILSPSGQHELLGKSEAAVGLLFNICLRPTLMIFGLVASILLAGTMIDLLNTTFAVMFLALSSNSGAGGPIGLVIYLVIYVTLIITVLNKCFAAIHLIPEKVGRWIGMQGEQYGESADSIKGAISSTADRTSAAAGDARNKATTARKEHDKDKKDAERANIAAGKGDSGDNKSDT